MLEHLKQEAARTQTENGAASWQSTGSDCLDLFAALGGLRAAPKEDILARFDRAWTEDPALCLRLLFFARDVRGGLGERRLFRVILPHLAAIAPDTVRRNLAQVPFFGRWDDLLCLLDGPCRRDVLLLIRDGLLRDIAAVRSGSSVSLLAKWLPSVNASNPDTVRRAKDLARGLGLRERGYRRLLSILRARLDLAENNLRTGCFDFSYEALPSQALHRYRKAFLRRDEARFAAFRAAVERGEAKLHTGTLAPYEILRPFYAFPGPDAAEAAAIDLTWRSQEDFTRGENALVVADGSGSMYTSDNPSPAAVAQSLAIYFAERNRGPFRNHFITFSMKPQLIELKGETIAERLRYCRSFREVANTDLEKVFDLILQTALRHGLPQSELPARLYIISDMEFDVCAKGASLTNFEAARRSYAAAGYELPQVVFWNVASRHGHQPVRKNEQGVALVSGSSPRLFSLLKSGSLEPLAFMLECLGAARYDVLQL